MALEYHMRATDRQPSRITLDSRTGQVAHAKAFLAEASSPL